MLNDIDHGTGTLAEEVAGVITRYIGSDAIEIQRINGPVERYRFRRVDNEDNGALTTYPLRYHGGYFVLDLA